MSTETSTPTGRRGFLICAALMVVTAVVALVALPHDRDVKSLWEFFAKLVPFVLGVETVARLDVAWAKRLKAPVILLPLCFLVYFTYFVPKTFYYGGIKTDSDTSFNSLYYNVLILSPFLILAFALAFRLGGGAARTTRRLGYGTLLLMLSGLEDLAFLLVNDLKGTPFAGIPDVWFWPSHMRVFFGHWPTRNEAFAFIAIHVVLALFVLFTPDKTVNKLVTKIGETFTKLVAKLRELRTRRTGRTSGAQPVAPRTSAAAE